jgi:hypothetical protein
VLFAACLLSSLVAIAIVLRGVQRYKRFLRKSQVFSHVKIAISFLTITTTLGQFGIRWPAEFATALEAVVSAQSAVGSKCSRLKVQ